MLQFPPSSELIVRISRLFSSDRKVKTTYYTASIGGDNVEAGREVARFLASKLDGKGTVVEITGLKDASPVIERHRGFHEVMKNYPGIKRRHPGKQLEVRACPGVNEAISG